MPQGPDLSANLLALHPLLAGEPHPDAHTAGIQRGIAQRFIRALCRAVPVRGGGHFFRLLPLPCPLLGMVSLWCTAPVPS
jgi:hypothetical protein